ncbi:MAG: polysaccharide biosynthesis C-terminal domain-containing protein [Paludibacteraceae bacterium]|nr:polysaccharide biosynthesis C-terminal domain-containing protein [Paludibacteraceae bacterium]
MGGIYKKILKNEYMFSILTKGLMVCIGLIESAILARYLGAELRGELSYIYSISSTGYVLMTFGIYTAYPFERKKCITSESVQKLIDIFMTQVITLFLVYLFINIFIILLFTTKQINYVSISTLTLFLGFDNVVTFVYLIEHPNQANLISVLANLIQLVFIVASYILLPQNILFGVAYYLIGSLIKILYCYKQLKIHYSLSEFKIRILLGYIKFGFFPMIALLFTTLNYKLDVIMLKQFSGIAVSSIGVYSIGIGLSEKALLIPDTVKYVLISRLSKGKDETEVAKVMRLCFLTSILTAISIMILGKYVIGILYGSEYVGAEEITNVTIWGTCVMVFFKMISQYNIVQHKQYLNIMFLSIAIILNLLFNLLLIPRYGIFGAAIATIIGHFVSSAIFLIYFHGVSKLPYKELVIVKKEDIHDLLRLVKR